MAGGGQGGSGGGPGGTFLGRSFLFKGEGSATEDISDNFGVEIFSLSASEWHIFLLFVANRLENLLPFVSEGGKTHF